MAQRRDYDEDDDRPRPKRRRPIDDDDEDFDDRPRRRRRRDDDDEDYDDGGGNVVSSVIPYKNPYALTAYYCGVFSLIPGLGCLLSPAAIVFGIMGIVRANSRRKSKGMAHAITGIVLGLVVAPAVWAGVYFLVTNLGK